MTAFKVGQKVKKVARRRPEDHTPGRARMRVAPIGAEGTILRFEDRQVVVRWDRYPSPWIDGAASVMPYMIAPLTDPGADAFIERIKKLKPYDEPVVTKEEERERIRQRAYQRVGYIDALNAGNTARNV